MKIYTRTGDKGETSLFGGARVLKCHLRVASYGAVDELNSSLGISIALSSDPEIKLWLEQVQKQLFALGSWLASPTASQNVIEGKDAFTGERAERASISDEHIQSMENQIDSWEKELKPMTAFILPGGSSVGAYIHFARTICRRAERDAITLRESGEVVPQIIIQYLNRLADALFVLARVANKRSGVPETEWR